MINSMTEFMETQAGKDAAEHSNAALNELITTGNLSATTPQNCHVAFAMMSMMTETVLQQRILWNLADGLEKNPELAAQVWDMISEAVKAGECGPGCNH